MENFWHDVIVLPLAAGGGWLLVVTAIGLFGKYVLGTMPWHWPFKSS